MKVIIGADHAGYPLKEILVPQLRAAGYAVEDVGTYSTEPVDYPDYAKKVAEAVLIAHAERGILVCGSGQGSAVAANKFFGIRAALVTDSYSAWQSVGHDDANILCLGARVTGPALAWELTRTWLEARFSGEDRHCRRLAKIAALEQRFPLLELHRAGQSVWMDNIQRGLLETGEFRELIRQGVTGVTSNPTILEKAISSSPDYEAATLRMARQGLEPRDIAFRLWVEDIAEAADQLRPVYELTEGADGFVSIEVDAALAHDTDGTLTQARHLWRELSRPNVMVKVPGTPAGLPAIQQLISEGINVNITLLFSQQRHDEVMDAYLAGLDARADDGRPVDRVASVASFFISRVDSAVDKLLEAKLQAARSDAERAELQALLGKAAVANAKLAYERFLQRFSGARWERLARQGARVQRPLWASTSTKNPAYRDVLYVEELIGPDTVNTMPPQTIEAYLDHGYTRRSVDAAVAQARADLAGLARHGIDLDAVTEQLQVEGVQLFADSFDKLLASIADKRGRALGGGESQMRVQLGPAASIVAEATRRLTEADAVRRLRGHDATLWPVDALAQRAIANRLGWLSVVEAMQGRLDNLRGFADEIAAAGFRRAVLLGMGGSSLAPEVLRTTFGVGRHGIDLVVLDTTDPSTITAVERSLDLDQTLFLVASKSGTTVETLSHFAYFWARTGGRGEQFVAITDPASPLEALARERGFRRVFLNPPDIGGRYSALSYFGLVPAALLGLDLEALLDRADHLAETYLASADSPGLQLGAILGGAARAGRDKVTLVLPDALASFGTWVEQLLAESTGKAGTGLIPIVGEPLGAPAVYGSDRVFVRLTLPPADAQDGAHGEDAGRGQGAGKGQGAASSAPTEAVGGDPLAALAAAGHPTVTIPLRDTLDVGGEFFRWEFATAVAGFVLGINPFDEPNVQEAKDYTRRVLDEFQRLGRLPDAAGEVGPDGLAGFLEGMQPGDYLALQAYLPYRDSVRAALATLRGQLRDRLHVATTLGFGPRYLHSTGQLHKGGPNTGVFLQLTADSSDDVPIPGQPYGFATLLAAQALGDLQALQAHGRRVRRVHLGADPEAGLRALIDALARGR